MRDLQREFHGRVGVACPGDNRRWVSPITTQPEIDFQPYLQSVATTYAKWWQLYTLTDAAGKLRQEKDPAPMFDFGLMVQTVVKEKQERGNTEEAPGEQEKIERFSVLEGIRKYAEQQVLLVGRPGSGKSTALARLMLEEATTAQSRIPVLVELRYWQGSLSDLILNAIARHDSALKAVPLESWLAKALILFDGVNELPSEEARSQLIAFRRNHPKLPMIFTTRDLSLGGDLGIEKKLEMQPLTEPQMQAFIRAYVPGQAEAMLRQLKARLREFGRTPLLLWMLCSLFQQTGEIPENLGMVFRLFTQGYERKLKQDVVIESDRAWWQPVLQQLAWVMMQGTQPTELRAAIPREEAVRAIAQFLNGKVPYAEDFTRKCLRDLQKHHLIQAGTNPEELEFRHQLLQEYYAAEWLLERVERVERVEQMDDETLACDYLNYLKWTEPLALMLALVTDEGLAVRLVEQALAVDLQLGARLVGEVNPEFQAQTVKFVEDLEVPHWLKIQLLGETRVESAINVLIKLLNDSDVRLRQGVVRALGEIDSAQAVDLLTQLLDDPAISVRKRAITVLGEIDSAQAVDALIQVWTSGETILSNYAAEILAQALKNQNPVVFNRIGKVLISLNTTKASDTLSQATNYLDFNTQQTTDKLAEKSTSGENSEQRWVTTSSEESIASLVQALNNSNPDERLLAANALIKIGSEQVVSTLVQTFSDLNQDGCRAALRIFSKIGSKQASAVIAQTFNYSNPNLRRAAVNALGNIKSEDAIPVLKDVLKNLKSFDKKTRSSIKQNIIKALGNTRSEEVIPSLIQALNDSNANVRQAAAAALGKTRSEEAIPVLIRTLNDPKTNVCQAAAAALGEIGSKKAIPELVQAFNNPRFSNSIVQIRLIKALGKTKSEEAIPMLIQILNDSSWNLRRIAVTALGEIGSEEAISALVQALNNSSFNLRLDIIEALGKIGSKEAIPALMQALDDSKLIVRQFAATALEKIRNDSNYYGRYEQAISSFIQALNTSDSDRCRVVAKVLLNSRSKPYVVALKQALSNLNPYVDEGESEPPQEISSEESIPLLIKSLDHPVANEREQAAQALGETCSKQAVDGLIRLMNDPVSFVRGSAAQALGEIRSEQAVDPLIQALSDPVSGVRWRVAEALGNIASERAIFPLVRAVEDSDSVVRETVAEALGKIKGVKIAQQLPTLVKMLPGKGGQEIILAIAAIQNHCKFYNYEIFQAHLAVQNADRPTNLTSDRPITYEVNAEVVQIVENNYGTIHGKQTP